MSTYGPHLTGRRHKQHRETLQGRALCGRLNVHTFTESILADRFINCPDCQVLMQERKQRREARS